MDAENDNWYANDILRNKMKRQVYLRNGVWCFVDTNEAVIGQVITEEEIRKDLDTYKISLMSIFSKVGPILLFYGTVQIALNLINEDSSLKPK
ncbi:hypothetical protein ROZALSC1DRAFT_31448 [Rozella allomycis CSF55]|uniref:Uncharacterized protein n=1 Tax=Rozella allomycis (strain CSF55) TaxID=988480 RepID=A0A075AUY6_ROZAC|nr:hypothetical protein O9G_004385 [Rozella allomycis CSF55]RKP16659.1 hypothetical protein ROZALSC1DRAFT_31448 [Rozella allomycis CSF55]|eukprot:EPZ33980.1 hypothetical protein O9G_004385 [Rozella allomycis CSF55]